MSSEEARRQAFEREREVKIRRFGWVVQFIVPAEGASRRPFAHTVGLTDHGLPELITFSASADLSQVLLNDVAADMMTRRAIGTSVLGRYTHARWPIAFHCIEADSAWAKGFAVDAWQRSSGKSKFLQVVWPSTKGVFPWDEAAEVADLERQPILGVPPAR